MKPKLKARVGKWEKDKQINIQKMSRPLFKKKTIGGNVAAPTPFHLTLNALRKQKTKKVSKIKKLREIINLFRFWLPELENKYTKNCYSFEKVVKSFCSLFVVISELYFCCYISTVLVFRFVFLKYYAILYAGEARLL